MQRVLIVGGGIGGLALAGAIGRRGVDVHVVDNQPEWSITRSGIVLQAPAVRALAALGLVDAVTAAGFAMTGFRYYDATARHDGAGARRPGGRARRRHEQTPGFDVAAFERRVWGELAKAP